MLKLDDLEPGTLYRLKMGESIVYAKTLEGNRTNVPPPANLHVTELENELELSWDPPDCDSITSYLIRNNGKIIGEGTVLQPHCTNKELMNRNLVNHESKGSKCKLYNNISSLWHTNAPIKRYT